MSTSLAILSLAGLFLVLGFSADQVTKNLRLLAVKLGIPMLLLGMLLGLLTSFPEGAIAINAMLNNIQGLSVGNLLGGSVVMLSLILGLGIVLNKEIKNDGRLGFLILCLVYLLLPLALASKGYLNYIDGILMIIIYFILITRLYTTNNFHNNLKVAFLNEAKIAREIFIVLGGIVLILLSSHFIIDITTDLLREYNLSPFIIGLLFFPIGTNLPELTVAITSWRRKDKELSFSNLLGSSIANILILGILIIIRTFPINLDYNYYITLIFLSIIILVILIFYRSGKRLAFSEGIALIVIYALYIFMQFRSGPLNL